ncbi:MAG: hypothetical protein WCH44_00425 [Betaproteobacteria bacterium]
MQFEFFHDAGGNFLIREAVKFLPNGTQLGVDFDLAVELYFLGEARFKLDSRCLLSPSLSLSSDFSA